jgi:SAM-dependent methyltransferase
MKLNWINPEDYSFNSFLLMERFQIRMMMDLADLLKDSARWQLDMGIALNANPAVRWYLERRCPECAAKITELAENAPVLTDSTLIRKAETQALAEWEAFVVYTTPEVMAKKCDFIRNWNKQRLFELADFTGKTVLDAGAGTGRLTFAAAEKADWVYASEPIGILREFMRDKIEKENIKNVRVLDGLVTRLPFPDNTFDIVMTGYVLGLSFDSEIAELTRVCKSGGWLLDCPADSEHDETKPSAELTGRGWEAICYAGNYGRDVCMNRKRIEKN